jgi:uncharacterized RDD family membrane protein YckC
MNETVTYEEKPKREFAELAGLGERFVAALVDGFIVSVITGVLSRFGGPGFGLSFVITLAYTWYFLTRKNGQTPGKMLMHIRVIKKDGSQLDDATAIVRYIAYYISCIIVIGILWAFWDDKKQGWHDKVANTLVVKA